MQVKHAEIKMKTAKAIIEKRENKWREKISETIKVNFNFLFRISFIQLSVLQKRRKSEFIGDIFDERQNENPAERPEMKWKWKRSLPIVISMMCSCFIPERHSNYCSLEDEWEMNKITFYPTFKEGKARFLIEIE